MLDINNSLLASYSNIALDRIDKYQLGVAAVFSILIIHASRLLWSQFTASKMSITVKWNREKLIIPFSSLETPLGTIRQALSSQTGLEPKAFKLLHAGAVMKDDSAPLSAYGIRNGSRVALIDGAANAVKGKPEKKEKARPTTEEGTIAVIKDELTKVNDRLVPALDIFLQTINPTGTTVTTTEPLSSTQDGNATKTISQPSSLSIPTPSRQSSLSTGAISDIDMEHRRLGEELLQSLLRLDIIALDGAWTSARAERKAAVKAVQALLDRLDSGWRARKERLQTGA